MGYDGPAVFRVPYGNDAALQNFENTVVDGVPVDRVREHVDDPPASDGVVRLWGTTTSNDGTWQDVEVGDYLIFYRNGTYTHAARVLGTAIEDSLSRAVWP